MQKERTETTMNQKQAREEVKNFLKDEVESITEKSVKGGNGMYNCPFCGSGTGANGTGAFSIDKKDTTKWHCFACGRGGDIIDLIKEYKKLDTAEAFKYAYSKYHIVIDEAEPTPKEPAKQKKEGETHTVLEEKQDYTEQYKFFNSCLKETDYLEKRGISKATADRFLIGYCKGWKHPYSKKGYEEALIIPNSKHSYTARNLKPTGKNDRYINVGEAGIFAFDEATGQSEWPVFVVEGEIDAMSFYEVGAYAVGLGSASNANKFIEALNKYLESHENINKLLICLDNDDVGQQTAERLINTLTKINNARNGLKMPLVRFENITVLKAYKDANDFLTADRKGFEMFVKQYNVSKKDEYLKNSTYYHLNDFLQGIKGNAYTKAMPTGYEGLDKALDGGLYEGLYVVGGVSSLGKTTYILQMADQIAESGEDVLIFSLEMATDELIAKSISRYTASAEVRGKLSINCAKTNRGITDYKRYAKYSETDKGLIDKAIEKYRDISKCVYIREGVGDIGVKQIREAVENHIQLTNKKPVVVIDYLQMIAPYSERMTERMNTDRNITELKRISRDFKLPLIAISSVARGNYNKSMSEESYKESGAIEYTADVLLGLQFEGQDSKDFNLTEAKSKPQREIELVILKNRNGRVGNKVSYCYYPMFNLFEEQEEH